MEKNDDMKNSKNSDLLKICIKYSCQSTYNHVNTNIAKSTFTEPHNIMGSAISAQIYKIKMHQSNIPLDKTAVFSLLLHGFEMKLFV